MDQWPLHRTLKKCGSKFQNVCVDAFYPKLLHIIYLWRNSNKKKRSKFFCSLHGWIHRVLINSFTEIRFYNKKIILFHIIFLQFIILSNQKLKKECRSDTNEKKLRNWLFSCTQTLLLLLTTVVMSLQYIDECCMWHVWEGGQVHTGIWCGNLKTQLGRSRSRWKYNIKMNLK